MHKYNINICKKKKNNERKVSFSVNRRNQEEASLNWAALDVQKLSRAEEKPSPVPTNIHSRYTHKSTLLFLALVQFEYGGCKNNVKVMLNV